MFRSDMNIQMTVDIYNCTVEFRFPDDSILFSVKNCGILQSKDC